YDGQVMWLYAELKYGNPADPISIPGEFGFKHWPNQVEAEYVKLRLASYAKWQADTEKELEQEGRAPLREDYYRQQTKEGLEYDIKALYDGWYKDRILTDDPPRKMHRPDLPARIYRGRMREVLLIICKNDMQESEKKGTSIKELFQIFDKIADI